MLVHLLATVRSSESELLDAAARVAASHQALSGYETRIRNLMALLTIRADLVRGISGDPSSVFDNFERFVTATAKLQGEAVRAIWQQPMLKPKDAAAALGARPSNREKVRRLRERSSVLGLPHGNAYLYPAFQFDLRRRVIFEEVTEVNERLGSSDDPWGVASWWFSPHARLGARPADLVGSGRADDLAAVAGALTEPLG